MAVINGRLDAALLAPVPGGQLRIDAADAWKRLIADVRARYGITLAPTSYVDTFRPYSVQERIFRQRYTDQYVTGIDPRSWLGRTWWRLAGYAAAAVPGTSNHGWGTAVDIAYMGGFTSAKYKAVSACAPAHGWDNREGRSINEPWHWVYVPANDTRPTAAPAATEADMTPEQDNLLRHVVAMLTESPGRTAALVWAQPVSRVVGKPTTALQDMVDGTTAALAVRALLDPDSDGVLDGPTVDVDEAALAAALAPLLPKAIASMSDADLARNAKATADELDRRARTRLA